MRFEIGDLVKFSPWGMEYPGFGVVIDDDGHPNDDGWTGHEVRVLGPDGIVWTLYAEQLKKVQDDG